MNTPESTYEVTGDTPWFVVALMMMSPDQKNVGLRTALLQAEDAKSALSAVAHLESAAGHGQAKILAADVIAIADYGTFSGHEDVAGLPGEELEKMAKGDPRFKDFDSVKRPKGTLQ